MPKKNDFFFGDKRTTLNSDLISTQMRDSPWPYGPVLYAFPHLVMSFETLIIHFTLVFSCDVPCVGLKLSLVKYPQLSSNSPYIKIKIPEEIRTMCKCIFRHGCSPKRPIEMKRIESKCGVGGIHVYHQSALKSAKGS